ncbi:MAG: hypothetical protein N2510_06100 [Ignavibacteria bacterium]|nr:hypothetical protein [Ignavibacteria bacterium]
MHVFIAMISQNEKYFLFNVKDEFLIELASHPRGIIEKFRTKLLKRKGADNQKNLKLLDLALNIIENENYESWKPSYLTEKLSVRVRMLDCHKSRLINRLRSFIISEKNIDKSDPDQLFRMGYLKEAWRLIMKENQTFEKTHDNLSLSENYYKLVFYYSLNGDRRNMLKYFNKLKLLYKEDNRDKIRFNFLRAFIICVKARKNIPKYHSELLTICKEMLSLARRINDEDYISECYLRLAQLYDKMKKPQRAIAFFKKGCEYNFKKSLENNALVFKSHLLIQEFKLNNSIATEIINQIESYYLKILENYTNIEQLLEIEFCYLKILIYLNHPDSDRISEDFIKHQFISSRKSGAVTSWYLELTDRIASSIYNWYIIGDKLSVNVNYKALNQFEKINSQALFHYRHLQTKNSLAIIYINSIEQEFWKAYKADFELAELWAKKLKRLVNTYELSISPSWFESSILGLKIFRELELRKKNIVYRKYESSLLKFMETLKSPTMRYNMVSDLAKLTYIADILKLKVFDEQISRLWEWVNENKPEVKKAISESIICK